MHAMIALYDSDLRDEVFTLLELSNVKNYTQFTQLHGSSQHGKKEGTVAWPGSNEIVLIVISEEQRELLKQVVSQYKQERKKSPPLLVFDWPLAEVL